jgi:hypothetical protein
MMAWYSKLLSPIVDVVGGYFKEKQRNKAVKTQRKDELTSAKHSAYVARVKRGDVAEADYDRIAQENARNSVADELMITWVLTIVTLLFIPATAQYATAGFKSLAEVPLWFQLVVLGGFISKFGLRFMFAKTDKFTKILRG